jgi:hypothetical protein
LCRDLRSNLQQQGRLADAGVAADQGGGAGDHAAAERAVELGDAAAEPFGQRRLGVEPDQFDAAAAAAQIMPRRERRHHPGGVLDQAVPLAAIAALAGPAAGDRAAQLADIAFAGLGHQEAGQRSARRASATSSGVTPAWLRERRLDSSRIST